jgi:Flp pilus assembly protein TadG
VSLRTIFLRARGTRGATLLEFAIILPLFLLLVTGILEFARAFNIYQVVVNSARVGARITALPPGSQSSSAIVNAKINEYLQSNGLQGCAPGCVTIEGMSGGPGTPAGVTVQYPYTFTTFGPMAALLGGDDPGTITLSSTSRMRNE